MHRSRTNRQLAEIRGRRSPGCWRPPWEWFLHWFWWGRWCGCRAGLGLLRLMGILRGGRTQFNVDQPTVVRQIQQLQRLETVSYTMDKIISGEHSNAYLPKFLAGDRLLLVVHGEVIGGINLAGLQPGDVWYKGRKCRFTCPPRKSSARESIMRGREYIPVTPAYSLPRIPTSKAKCARRPSASCSKPRCRMAFSKPPPTTRAAQSRACYMGFGFHEVDIR